MKVRKATWWRLIFLLFQGLILASYLGERPQEECINPLPGIVHIMSGILDKETYMAKMDAAIFFIVSMPSYITFQKASPISERYLHGDRTLSGLLEKEHLYETKKVSDLHRMIQHSYLTMDNLSVPKQLIFFGMVPGISICTDSTDNHDSLPAVEDQSGNADDELNEGSHSGANIVARNGVTAPENPAAPAITPGDTQQSGTQSTEAAEGNTGQPNDGVAQDNADLTVRVSVIDPNSGQSDAATGTKEGNENVQTQSDTSNTQECGGGGSASETTNQHNPQSGSSEKHDSNQYNRHSGSHGHGAATTNQHNPHSGSNGHSHPRVHISVSGPLDLRIRPLSQLTDVSARRAAMPATPRFTRSGVMGSYWVYPRFYPYSIADVIDSMRRYHRTPTPTAHQNSRDSISISSNGHCWPVNGAEQSNMNPAIPYAHASSYPTLRFLPHSRSAHRLEPYGRPQQYIVSPSQGQPPVHTHTNQVPNQLQTTSNGRPPVVSGHHMQPPATHSSQSHSSQQQSLMSMHNPMNPYEPAPWYATAATSPAATTSMNLPQFPYPTYNPMQSALMFQSMLSATAQRVARDPKTPPPPSQLPRSSNRRPTRTPRRRAGRSTPSGLPRGTSSHESMDQASNFPCEPMTGACLTEQTHGHTSMATGAGASFSFATPRAVNSKRGRGSRKRAETPQRASRMPPLMPIEQEQQQCPSKCQHDYSEQSRSNPQQEESTHYFRSITPMPTLRLRDSDEVTSATSTNVNYVSPYQDREGTSSIQAPHTFRPIPSPLLQSEPQGQPIMSPRRENPMAKPKPKKNTNPPEASQATNIGAQLPASWSLRTISDQYLHRHQPHQEQRGLDPTGNGMYGGGQRGQVPHNYQQISPNPQLIPHPQFPQVSLMASTQNVMPVHDPSLAHGQFASTTENGNRLSSNNPENYHMLPHGSNQNKQN